MCLDFGNRGIDLICNFLITHKKYFDSLGDNISCCIDETEVNRFHDYNTAYELAINIFFELTAGDYNEVDSVVAKLQKEKR